MLCLLCVLLVVTSPHIDLCEQDLKNNHREILERELECVGMRLNKRPPDIYLKKKKAGGVHFNSSGCKLTKLGDDPERCVCTYSTHCLFVCFSCCLTPCGIVGV